MGFASDQKVGRMYSFTPFHLSNADYLSVKSNSYLITFKDADPLGSAFEMLKGV